MKKELFSSASPIFFPGWVLPYWDSTGLCHWKAPPPPIYWPWQLLFDMYGAREVTFHSFLLWRFIAILSRFIELLCRFIELLLRYIEIIIAIYRIIIAIYRHIIAFYRNIYSDISTYYCVLSNYYFDKSK